LQPHGCGKPNSIWQKSLLLQVVKSLPMLILGIESSCDETGIALYDSEAGLLSHALHSQVAMHAEYGGVVPELASRDHIRRVVPLLRDALGSAQRTLADVDAVAYTRGPGRCITSKGICSRRCCRTIRRAFRSSPCWFPAAIRS
jgi:hypothetical protein